MIKEFALDPAVPAQSSKDFRYFLEALRIENGRVLARFPKAWCRMVYEAAQRFGHNDNELKRIEDSLAGIAKADRPLFTCGRPSGSPDASWIERAIAEHARLPFAAIITTTPAPGNEFILAADDANASPLFQSTGQREIVRTSEEMIESLGLLLRAAKRVKLIDPYYLGGGGRRWQRGLRKLIEVVREGATIEIHREDAGERLRNLESWLDAALERKLKPNVTVRVFLHPKAVMHNRYILTDQGGASLGAGLDDNEDARDDTVSDDDLILLTEDQRRAKWDKYSASSQPAIERGVAE